MAGIGIGSIGYNYNQYNPTRPTGQIATGKHITSAAVDPSGAAIAKGLENQSAGASQASNNAKDMVNLLNLSDGALGQITEGISRIRELGVQSQSGIYTDSDRAVFQKEIDGILQNINDIGKNTNYNGKSVLDGSFTAQNAAIGPNGEGMDVSIGNMLTDQLGLTGFSVADGNVDFDALDGATEMVNTQRADIGAMTNRLEYSARAMDNAAVNQEIARSRKEDTDIAEAEMERNHKRITEQVGISMQKMKMQGMGNFLQLIG